MSTGASPPLAVSVSQPIAIIDPGTSNPPPTSVEYSRSSGLLYPRRAIQRATVQSA
jgi:hypothetical protein